ncbi:MAG: thiamine-monophosphate kinase [Phycisphaerae bacterium]|jgi:thiamine-monophosphate kinase|nr:thiamine-monophosphate kinase [Phycisphaerae bacterium]
MRESDLLRRVYAANGLLPSCVKIPPGDDMAAISVDGGSILVAVDQVIEGRHVIVDEDPAMVGRKAIVRNVSDVAAMAARPLATLASVVLPRRYGEGRALQLFDGLRSTADLYGCPLIGGDTAIHADANGPLVVSVTILATPAWSGARVVTRRGSQVGDGLFVTGRLGGSLESGGGGRHLTFEPRLEEAIALLELLGDGLHAMLDLSDGVGRDAARLVDHPDSELGIEIDAAAVPTNAGLPWQRGLGDGEDYELLFTASGPVPEALFGLSVTRIGSVVARPGGRGPAVLVRDGDRHLDASDFGWEHAAT